MIKKIAFLVLSLMFATGSAYAQTCGALPNSLTNGTTADASQVMANLNTILNCANNNLAPNTAPNLTGPVTITGNTAISGTLSVGGNSLGTGAHSATANGYVVLPGNIIEEWGSVTVAAGAYTTVTIPVAFSQSVFSCVASSTVGATGAAPGCGGGSKSQINVFNPDSTSSRTINYIVIGF